MGRVRWGGMCPFTFPSSDVGSDLPGSPFSAGKVPESRVLCLVERPLADGLCERVWEMCCKAWLLEVRLTLRGRGGCSRILRPRYS